MLKYITKKIVTVQNWNNLVVETYKRPYHFQQQDGCKSRGIYTITIPDPYFDDFENDTVPEVINGEEMGVSFKAWLARDPKQQLSTSNELNKTHDLEMWYHRNFYPNIETVANDLYNKGLIEAGNYIIEIDW